MEAAQMSLTPSLLVQYAGAALDNAGELIAEARLLHAHLHKSRAYFLAVATIEETGKAQLAFDAQRRNLSDPAVLKRVLVSFGDHDSKINSAFIPWIEASSDKEQAVRSAVDLMVALKVGRAPAMYVDLSSTSERSVQSPSKVVRSRAAADCIDVASHCLVYAQRCREPHSGGRTSAVSDRFFSMKDSVSKAILRSEDFWWFFVAQMRAGDDRLEVAVLKYDAAHFKTSELFCPPSA